MGVEAIHLGSEDAGPLRAVDSAVNADIPTDGTISVGDEIVES